MFSRNLHNPFYKDIKINIYKLPLLWFNNIRNDEVATAFIEKEQSNIKYEEITSTLNGNKEITLADVSLPLNIKDFEKAIHFNVERHDEVKQDEEEGNPLDNYKIGSAETL